MKEIILTQGKVALVDDEDYDFINQYKWHEIRKRNNIYVARNVKVEGSIPKYNKWVIEYLHIFLLGKNNNLLIDHRDGNPLNNQKSNLRFVTKSQNNMNQTQGLRGENKYKGVYFSKKYNNYHSYITLKKKKIHLGCYDSEWEAAERYNQEATKLFGEYARLNQKKQSP